MIDTNSEPGNDALSDKPNLDFIKRKDSTEFRYNPVTFLWYGFLKK